MDEDDLLAFPHDINCVQWGKGMLLRDYFAAAALNGMIGGMAEKESATIATWAYELADAMLAARKKKG